MTGVITITIITTQRQRRDREAYSGLHKVMFLSMSRHKRPAVVRLIKLVGKNLGNLPGQPQLIITKPTKI